MTMFSVGWARRRGRRFPEPGHLAGRSNTPIYLTPGHSVEMFVTINTKHTRLKKDVIVSLSGRRLYRDELMAACRGQGLDPMSGRDLSRVLSPWSERIGDRRFETEGEWRLKSAGGGSRTVELLARELRDALL